MSADDLVQQLLENLGEEVPVSPAKPEGAIPGAGKYGAVYRFRVHTRPTAGNLPSDDTVAEATDAVANQPAADAEQERLRAEALAESIQEAEAYVNDLEERMTTGEALPVVSEAVGEDELEEILLPELEEGNESDLPIPEAYDEAAGEQNLPTGTTGTTDEFDEISDLAKEAVDAAAQAEEAEPLTGDAVTTGESPIAGLDEVDVNLMEIFGMDKELQEKIGTDEFRRLHEDGSKEELLGGFFPKEYESPEENKSFLDLFKRSYQSTLVRLIIGILLFVTAVVFECFRPLILSGMSNPRYLVVFTLAMLQITVFLTALALPEIFRGFRNLGKGKATPELIVAAACISNLLYEIALLITRSLSGTQTYNIPLAICVLSGIVYRVLGDRRDLLSFKIVSSRHGKFALTHLRNREGGLEKDAFGEYLTEDSEIFGVKEAEFIENYAARSVRQGSGKGVSAVLIPAALLCAVVFFVLGFFRHSGGNFASNFAAGASVAQLCLMLLLPACCLLGFALPFFRASEKAFRRGSAIIGDSALEEYADASVISFNDDSVFPEGKVKLRSMRLYGNNRIDLVLYKASSVFERLGGPLQPVFHAATKDLGVSEDTVIREIRRSGIDATVDGESVLIGSAAYMEEQGFRPPVADGDETLEYQSQISIMYIAIDGVIASKVFIEYRLDPEFEGIVKSLYRSGMCIGIRTLDPNINDVMLDRRIKLSKYPVRVLKCRAADELSKPSSRIDSGVVSKRSVKDLLRTLTSCEKVRQITHWNTIFALVSMVAGLAFTTLLFVFDRGGSFSPLFIGLYQLFWMIPTAIVSILLI